ncbi:hypothetical protein BOTBODRAFT_451314 [Botryobasidium botryosum FD-172 SS1]|uniref:Uncharacterized protein n=1 Tax=Botryobasidium botryosum (strain FD-172 SS1) TaxID=930990 RepID=A0A067MHZ4_BOTB1|nr:hypothetical protein BOTBODRAFT_451314 [Botryobasidium botryosum FD-172 SS1]
MAPRMLPGLFQALMDDCRNSLDENARSRLDRGAFRSSTTAQLELDEQLEVIQRVVADVTTYAQEMISRLRFRRNQLSAINRLPTDILLVIFQHARASFARDLPFPYYSRNHDLLAFPRLLLALSSVCRLWRDFITQHCPTLWVRPPMASITLLKLFLGRCKEAPIEIEFDAQKGGTHFSERISLIRSHINHCKDLHISFPRDGGTQEAVGLLRDFSPAPHLETLDLRRKRNTRRPNLVHHLPGLFAGVAPRLREIYLSGICIPLDSPFFRGLTYLKLHCIDYSNHGSIHQLFHILELSPLLKELFLDGIGLSVSVADIHSIPIIVLTHLRRLHLQCVSQSADLRYILRRLSIPPSCYLIIYGETGVPGDDLYELLPPPSVISANILPLMQPIRLLMLRISEDFIVLRGCSHGLQDEAYHITQMSEGIFRRTIPNLGHIFPMASLEGLHLNVDITDDLSDLLLHLADFLHRHPTIKTIDCDNLGVLELLIVTPTRHFCPLLHSLQFRTASWTVPCEAAMIRLVESRTARGDGENSVLRHVTLRGRTDFSGSGLATLRMRVEVEVATS